MNDRRGDDGFVRARRHDGAVDRADDRGQSRWHGRAGGLIEAGLQTGDRVGIWSPNCAEWTLVQYATAKLGVILVNINRAYRTSELEYALRQSGCRLLIAAPAFKTSDYRAMVDEVRPQLPEL